MCCASSATTRSHGTVDEGLVVEPHGAVGRQHEAVVESAEVAAGAVEAAYGDAGCEPVDLVLPVAHQAGRADHQRRPGRQPAKAPVQVQRDQGDRLAQPHVVGQAGAEARAGELGEPGEAVALVVAQRRLQAHRSLQRGHHGGVDDAVADLLQRGSGMHLEGATVEVELAGQRRLQGDHRLHRLGRLATASPAGDDRVDHHPVVAQPDHRRLRSREHGHLVVGQRVVAEGEPPVEGEQRVGTEQAVHQLALARTRRDVDPRLRHQLAPEPARPEHVDADGVERLEAVLEQVGQLVGVEHHPVGDLHPLQPVERRPRLRRGAQGPAEAEPCPAGEAVALCRSLAEPELVGVDEVGVVVHVVGLEHDDHTAALEHLAGRLDPQREADLVGQVRVLVVGRRRPVAGVRTWWCRAARVAASSCRRRRRAAAG